MSFWSQYWWVLFFSLFAAVCHFHFSKSKKCALQELAYRLEEMEKEKLQVQQRQEDLLLQIASQDDPAWIEMVLIRELGVVPEGFLKVHFKR